jgi:hypothetical protein
MHNDEVHELISIFDTYGVKYHNSLDDKLKEDDITARRLTRIFRYQIQDFIVKKKRPSYLWYKYSNHDSNYASICFPGGEHIIENENEYKYLFSVYENMDNKFGTKFCDRLNRVCLARGIKI